MKCMKIKKTFHFVKFRKLLSIKIKKKIFIHPPKSLLQIMLFPSIRIGLGNILFILRVYEKAKYSIILPYYAFNMLN